MKNLIFPLIAILFLFSACDNDDDNAITDGNVNLSFNGLEDLGPDYVYEGWVIVDGDPVSTGTFTVDGNGTLSTTSFEVPNTTLEAATTFVLTIEPTQDPDPAPSDAKYLAGDITNNQATVSTGIVGDFSAASGKFIFATPTTAATDDEFSGVWFLDNSSGSPVAGLSLPTLGAGWVYEGWAVVDGNPLSTGRFTSVNGQDDSNIFSGTDSQGPGYPGEDFINNAPAGLTFPLDLRDRPIVITIEPAEDNSPAPFTLKPLAATASVSAADHTVLNMNNQVNTFPTGTVNITLR